MVRRFFNLLQKEIGGLHEAAFLLGLSALASQLLGLARDRLLASSLGAGQELDIYYAAFRIPDLVYVTIASFVSVTVLIPFLIGLIERDERGEARRFLNQTMTIFLLVMIAVVAVLYFLVPHLTTLSAPGFDAASRAELVILTRILLLSPLLLGLSNLLGSITQSLRQFFVYALSPVFYNVGIIIGIVVFYPTMGIAGLAWGVILGALFHLAIQLPTIYRSGFLPQLTTSFDWQEIKKVVLISLPRTLTLATQQLSILILVSLASYMAKGSIALFNFSYNLQSVPLAIVGVSYSVAAFPSLTKVFSSGQKDEFIRQLSNATRHIIFWSLPATGLFIVLRAQIVRVILGAGKFNWENTRLTAAALAIFAVSILAQSLILLFVRAYYAGGQTARPLLVNVGSSIFTIFLAYFLNVVFGSWPLFRYFVEALFRVTDVSGTAFLSLPLAFSIGSLANLFILWWAVEKDFGRLRREVGRAFYQVFAASVFGGFLAYQSLFVLAAVFNIHTFWGIFTQGFLAGLVGIISHLLLLSALKNRDLEEVAQAFRSRFWKTKVVAPEPESL